MIFLKISLEHHAHFYNGVKFPVRGFSVPPTGKVGGTRKYSWFKKVLLTPLKKTKNQKIIFFEILKTFSWSEGARPTGG